MAGSVVHGQGQGNLPFWRVGGNPNVGVSNSYLGPLNAVQLRVGAGGTTAIYVQPDGKVGIGTANPQARLDVAGTVKAQRFVIGGRTEIKPAASPQVGVPDTFVLDTRSLLLLSRETDSLRMVTMQVVGAGSFSAVNVGGALIAPRWFFDAVLGQVGPPGKVLPDSLVRKDIPVPAGEEIIISTQCFDLILNPEDSGYYYNPNWGNFGEAGLVGIGTANPQKKLHVFTMHRDSISCPSPDTEVQLAGSHEGIRIENIDRQGRRSVWDIEPEVDSSGVPYLGIGMPGNRHVLRVDSGRVSVHTPGTGEEVMRVHVGTRKVYVRGLKVTMGDFPDHVFEEGYELEPLSERMAVIRGEGRLPGMPSREEVIAEGADVGEVIYHLVRHVEELYLYIDQLERRIEEMEEKIGGR